MNGGGCRECARWFSPVFFSTLKEWQGESFRGTFESGQIEARPGVLRMMDEAREAGMKLAVCSADARSDMTHAVIHLGLHA